jgi:hypothetical protein
MAIVNRTLDATEQRKILSQEYAATQLTNGITNLVGIVPWPCTIDAAAVALYGVSGAPTAALFVGRFIAGTGYTAFAVATGSSNTPADYGVSGFGANYATGMLLAASGSTLRNLLANDVLLYVTGGGTGAAAVIGTVSVVLRPLQDIKYNFGSAV